MDGSLWTNDAVKIPPTGGVTPTSLRPEAWLNDVSVPPVGVTRTLASPVPELVEVAQDAVASLDDITKSVDKVKKAGRKAVLLRLEDGKGDLRFVAVPVQ